MSAATQIRQFEYTATDLIDALTIAQIKEAIGPGDRRQAVSTEMDDLAHDLDLTRLDGGPKLSAGFLRLIVLLAQANLHVWTNKDKMASEPERYYDLLSFAQDMNGLRNHARNLLMERLGEDAPPNLRATFLDYTGESWYSSILAELDG